jgi:hypothetical protein
MNKPDLESKLRGLHTQLCEVLSIQLQDPEVSPSTLNVARQLLKDNGIDCAIAQDTPIYNLAERVPFGETKEAQ